MSWPNHERHCLALRIILDIDPLNSHVFTLYLALVSQSEVAFSIHLLVPINARTDLVVCGLRCAEPSLSGGTTLRPRVGANAPEY